MDKVPWQVYVGLIAFAIIAFLIIVIIVVAKNKNLNAKAETEKNKFGLSITDGESSGGDKTKKKNAIILTKEDNVNVALMRLNMLKIHPVFTTSFNYVLYKSDKLLESQKSIIDKLINTKRNPKNKILEETITKYSIILNTLIKNYILSFKSTLLKLIDDAETDITNDDKEFTNTLRSFKCFMEDTYNEINLYSVIDNLKCTGIITKNSNIEANEIPENIYTTFEKYIKSESSVLCRDIMISQYIIFSIDNNLFERYTYFVNGLEQLLNSVLQYTFILYSETKYKIIYELCKRCLNNELAPNAIEPELPIEELNGETIEMAEEVIEEDGKGEKQNG